VSHPRIEPPYDLSPHRAALVGIDFQQAFGEGAWEDVPGAAAAIDRFRVAATAWRAAGGQVVMVREAYTPEDFPDAVRDEIALRHPLMLGSHNTEFHPDLLVEGDLSIVKKGFSAFAASELPTVLAERGWDTVIIGGLTTPICVTTTADGLSMAGVKVVILSDACASQPFDGVSAELAHHVALARFRYQFGQTLTTEEFVRVASLISSR
jgi:nicotinamidase-related amidase